MKHITYGEGGYDPTRPDSNVVEERDEPDQDAPTLGEVLAPQMDALSAALRSGDLATAAQHTDKMAAALRQAG